jgi:hypothetical protein
MGDQLISAYLWGYKNYEAGVKSIQTFKHFYPTSDVFVRIDIDGDLENYKSCLSELNINIASQESKLGYPGKFSPSGHDAGREHWPYKNLYTWLKSIYDCCKTTDSKYMIILEEDVFILKPISIIESEFGVAIVRNKNYFPERIIEFIKEVGGNIETAGYGACGGAIINVQDFIKGFDLAMPLLEDQFEDIASYTKFVGWSDMMLQVIVMCGSGSVAINWQLIEPWMEEQRWILDSWVNYEIVNYLKDHTLIEL